MKGKNISTEDFKNYENIILDITNNYEAGERFWILYGLEILGFKNMEFWLKVVNQVKKFKGLESLEIYITLMKKIPRKDLLTILEKINDKNHYPRFEEAYLIFINLLFKVSEIVGEKETFIVNKK